MSSLLDSLRSGGNSLQVFERALDVIQNNVTNASTPGYATQSLRLEAQPFDVAGGLAGGVSGRGLDSARNEYAEDEVRRQLQSAGFFDAQAQGAGSVERLFDVSGTGGVSGALAQLYQSFSAWSADPGSSTARQAVIDAAGSLSSSVKSVWTGLTQTAAGLKDQVGSTVDQINQLATTIQQYNQARRQSDTPDPGQDANVHAALEQLAKLVDGTTLTQPDGTITVVLSGGAPLVAGNVRYPIQASQDEAGRPVIRDSQGADITSQAGGGQLGGLLDTALRIVPATQDSLNQFAASFGSTVNDILAGGTTAPGGETPGAPLFTFDPANPAATFQLNSAVKPEDLAPVDSSGANGNALKLASLANSASAGGIGGATFGDFFSQIAASAGRESASAQANSQTQQQAADQARALRDRISGVSLDEQATLLMQFQRGYQAAARLITTLNAMLDDTLNLIR